MADNQEILKTMRTGLSPLLLEAGFKLKGKNFVRETEPGVYQLITLGLGGAFSMMANHVSISFAITTEEWLQNFLNWKRPKILTVGDYEIKSCYWGAQLKEHNGWYSIEQEVPILLNNISSYLKESVLPYLEKMKNRKGIIYNGKVYRDDEGKITPRNTLLIASLLILTGTDQEKEEGISMLKHLLTADYNTPYIIEKAEQFLKEHSPKQ